MNESCPGNGLDLRAIADEALIEPEMHEKSRKELKEEDNDPTFEQQ